MVAIATFVVDQIATIVVFCNNCDCCCDNCELCNNCDHITIFIMMSIVKQTSEQVNTAMQECHLKSFAYSDISETSFDEICTFQGTGNLAMKSSYSGMLTMI